MTQSSVKQEPDNEREQEAEDEAMLSRSDRGIKEEEQAEADARGQGMQGDRWADDAEKMETQRNTFGDDEESQDDTESEGSQHEKADMLVEGRLSEHRETTVAWKGSGDEVEERRAKADWNDQNPDTQWTQVPTSSRQVEPLEDLNNVEIISCDSEEDTEPRLGGNDDDDDNDDDLVLNKRSKKAASKPRTLTEVTKGMLQEPLADLHDKETCQETRLPLQDHSKGVPHLRRSAAEDDQWEKSVPAHQQEALVAVPEEAASGCEDSPLREALSVFARFEHSGGSDPAAALARLRVLRCGATGSRACADVWTALERCADRVLSCGPCSSSASLVTACLDLLSAAADEAEAEEGCKGKLLIWLVGRLHAVGARAARVRGAELLRRLLPGCLAMPDKAAAAAEVLLSLARDKAPSVRSVAAQGLCQLPGEAAMAAVLLACHDPVTSVRTAALSCLGGSTVHQASSRCLDACWKVRSCFFSALAESSSPLRPELICSGLRDKSPDVRAACERWLCQWLRRAQCVGTSSGSAAGSSTRNGSDSLSYWPLLVELTQDILSVGGVHAEEVAEAALKIVVCQQDWGATIGSVAISAYAPAPSLATAHFLAQRVAAAVAACETEQQPNPQPKPLSPAAVALASLRSGAGEGELRQLLKAVLTAPAEGGRCCCLELARAVLHEAPAAETQGWKQLEIKGAGWSCTSALGLAVAVARQAFGARAGPRRSSRQLREAEVEFSAFIKSVLEEQLQGGLEGLGAQFDLLLRDKQASKSELIPVADKLSAASFRMLLIVDEALSSQSCPEAWTCAFVREGGSPDVPSDDLLQRWLCPSLARADAGEAALGGSAWAVLRSLAVRCIALRTSGDAEAAMAHWPFFLSVLSRYAPIAASYADKAEVHAGQAAESITETCVLFLSDVLLVHGGPSGWLQDSARRAKELFAAILEVLGPAAVLSTGAATTLWRRLCERLVTLLLYGGAWAGLQQEDCLDCMFAASPARPHLAASWALTRMMLEAFHQPLPQRPAPAREELLQLHQLSKEAAGAAHRGRLLCFFSCLGRASAAHAALMASVGEIILCTELWRLGTQESLASNSAQVVGGNALSCLPPGMPKQWRQLHLPRLLRLLCQQLAASCVGNEGVTIFANQMADLWLTSIWRPFALLCLEAELVDALPLAEVLAAVVSPVQAVNNTGTAPLSAARQVWPLLSKEVAGTCQQIAVVWRRRQSFDPDCPGSGCSPVVAQALRTVRHLAESLLAAEAEGLHVENELDVAATCADASSRGFEEARERRLLLREELQELRVDTSCIVAAAKQAFQTDVQHMVRAERQAVRRPREGAEDDEEEDDLGLCGSSVLLGRPRTAPQKKCARTKHVVHASGLAAAGAKLGKGLARKHPAKPPSVPEVGRVRRAAAATLAGSDDDSDGSGGIFSLLHQSRKKKRHCKRPSSTLCLGRPGGS